MGIRNIRFGPFELDPQARELRKNGIRVKLENQPFDILAALLERPGDLVTRSELQARIWPEGTFVDFEKGLVKAINKIRTALCDSATTPRYIETLSRRGYRFIQTVETVPTEAPLPQLPGDAAATAKLPAGLPGFPLLPINRKVAVGLAGVCVIVVVSVAALLHESWVSRRSSGTLRPSQIQSLAVLPIRNVSGDASQQYVADGLTELLSSDLAKIGSLRVISRTSTMRYNQSRQSVPEIAAQLGVDALLEGSVLRLEERLRIDLKVLHGRTERQVWAKTFEGGLTEMGRMQAQITLAVAHEISARITAETRSRMARWNSIDSRAYDAYLRGRYLWNQRGAEAITQAITHFEEAARLDPKLALAYSGLADCYSIGWGAVENYELAEGYAREAVALEPELAEGHASLGLAYCHQWKFPEAERELKRAVELDPSYVPAHQVYAIYLLTMGRATEALAENDRALQLDPFSLPVNNLRGHILVGLRAYERAIQQLHTAARIQPDSVVLYEQLARVYWLQGRAADALVAEREIVKRTSSQALLNGIARIEGLLARSGPRAACLASAQLKAEAYRNSPARAGYYPIMIPLQYGALGDRAMTMKLLQGELRHKGYGVVMLLKTAPELDFMRSDDQFQQLMRSAGLAE